MKAGRHLFQYFIWLFSSCSFNILLEHLHATIPTRVFFVPGDIAVAEGISLSYESWLAEHCHVMWTDNALSEPQLPEYRSDDVLQLPVAMFNQDLAPLKLGRFYPAWLLITDDAYSWALFRGVKLGSDDLSADLNHSLAGLACTLASERATGRTAVSVKTAGSLLAKLREVRRPYTTRS